MTAPASFARAAFVVLFMGVGTAAAQLPPAQPPAQPTDTQPAVPQTTAIEAPERPFQGLFGGEPRRTRMLSRSEFSFSFTLTGGYDDNLAGDTIGGAPPIGADSEVSGYSTVAAATLAYTVVRRRGAVTFFGSASGSQYSYFDYDGVPYGVNGGISGRAVLGRRSNFTGAVRIGREPYLQLGSFDSLRRVVGPDETPGNAPPFSLGDRSSLTYDVDAEIDRRFSRSDSLRLGYSLFARYFQEDATSVPVDPTVPAPPLVSDGDGMTNAVSARYVRALSRDWFIEPGYSYSRGSYATFGALGDRPLTQHNIHGDIRHERRVSPTKRLYLTFGGGATQIRTVNEAGAETQIWEPSGQANARLDIARTWALDAGYRRALVYLGGFTDDTYFTDAITLGASGLVGSRVRLTISGAASSGDATAAVAESGSFRSYIGSISIGIPLSRTMSISAGYLYYRYQFDDATTLPEDTPPDLDRNGVRVGFTLQLPGAARGTGVRQ